MSNPINAPPTFFHPPKLDPLQHILEMDAKHINLLSRHQTIVGNSHIAKLVISRHANSLPIRESFDVYYTKLALLSHGESQIITFLGNVLTNQLCILILLTTFAFQFSTTNPITNRDNLIIH